MSDSSEDESNCPSTSTKPSRPRKKLTVSKGAKTLVGGGTEEVVTGGMLTDVSSDYRRNLDWAENQTIVQKLKLDIEKRQNQERRRRVLLVSSSSSSEDETPNAATSTSSPLPHNPPKDLSPSPPRHRSLSSKQIDPEVKTGLAEIQKIRRNLAADRMKCSNGGSCSMRGLFGGEPTGAKDIREALQRVVDTNARTSGSPSMTHSLKIKVRSVSTGILRRVEMSPTETFASVYALLAREEKMPMENIRLTLNNSETVIKPDDTFLVHKLTIADIVECVVIRKDTTEKGDMEDDDPHESIFSNSITLKIQSLDSKTGQFTTVKTSKLAPLKTLMEEFAANRGSCVDKLVFFFDGERLDPSATPAQLDMEDDDCVDVNVLP